MIEKNCIKFTTNYIINNDKLEKKLFINYKFISSITHIFLKKKYNFNIYIDNDIDNNIFNKIVKDIINTINKKIDIYYFNNNILKYKYE